MRKTVLDFIHRGLVACGFGPLVLAVVYLALHQQGVVDQLSLQQVAKGIFSMTALAFVAGSMNGLYRIERLPLMLAILIHGCVLYAGYLATYLINDWLEMGCAPFLIFTAVFVGGYLVIWAIIYIVVNRRTRKLNETLRLRQKEASPAE